MIVLTEVSLYFRIFARFCLGDEAVKNRAKIQKWREFFVDTIDSYCMFAFKNTVLFENKLDYTNKQIQK